MIVYLMKWLTRVHFHTIIIIKDNVTNDSKLENDQISQKEKKYHRKRKEYHRKIANMQISFISFFLFL